MAKRSSSAVFIVFMLVIIALKVFLFRFGNLDEIWHYNLCRGITSGAVPYRDINLIGMPLYYFVCSLPLLLVKKFVVYRMAEILLIFSCALLSFVIVKAESGFGYAAVSALITVLFTDITSYNNLLFFFVLLIYLVNKRLPSFKRYFLLGVFTALCVWSRQTSGFIITIAETVYVIIEIRKKNTGKKNFLFYLAGFGIGAVHTEQSIAEWIIPSCLGLLFLGFMIFASKKLGWFSKVKKDDVALFNAKIEARRLKKA